MCYWVLSDKGWVYKRDANIPNSSFHMESAPRPLVKLFYDVGLKICTGAM